ncbi:MAG TPA: hypothetical protein VE684_19675 [Crenalkalicoccus sp.]|nr:hypothetical protein [Crenalkalicoccus sp.]
MAANQAKWSLPICVQLPFAPLWRAPVSSAVIGVPDQDEAAERTGIRDNDAGTGSGAEGAQVLEIALDVLERHRLMDATLLEEAVELVAGLDAEDLAQLVAGQAAGPERPQGEASSASRSRSAPAAVGRSAISSGMRRVTFMAGGTLPGPSAPGQRVAHDKGRYHAQESWKGPLVSERK